MRRIALLALACALAAAGCTAPGRPQPAAAPGATGSTTTAPAPPSTAPSPAPSTTTTTTRTTGTTTTVARPADTGSPAPDPPLPPYASSVSPLDEATRARMTGVSWREGCPLGLDALRLLRVRYVGFDGAAHDGELVVRADLAAPVVRVFAAIYESRFPIERMQLIDDYAGDDRRSMLADNTSGFNCRKVGGSDRWSEHAYGAAVDVNPFRNPYVRRSGVEPPEAAAYADRSRTDAGMVRSGGPAVAAFRSIGWGWGGAWRSGADYQHFSASGR